jgi:Fe-S-cluster-containing dehydrogenase component
MPLPDSGIGERTMTVPKILLVDTALCTACRACELACHFHHSNQFGTQLASVSIQYDGDSSNLRITFEASCDRCPEEEVPLCARFCGPGAIKVR